MPFAEEHEDRYIGVCGHSWAKEVYGLTARGTAESTQEQSALKA